MTLTSRANGTPGARSAAAASLRSSAGAPAFDAEDLLAAWQGRHRNSPAVGALAGPRAQLSTLAMSVQLDGFEKVKKTMEVSATARFITTRESNS